MLQNVKVSLNRSVTPKRIVVGNQFESGVEQIHFDIPDMEGYKYLVLNKPNKEESYPIPLDEGTFYVDSRVTYYLDGVWVANVVISKSAVTEGKLNPDVVTFISDDIILIVKNNYINNEYLKDLPLPQNLQIVYDKLFDTYTQIKSDYDSGAFDGKDGYSPTLDVTPIDNGNRITITDINGEKEIDVTNGIDGQSAYELAVKNGFEGSEQEWLESLKGEPGKKGDPGEKGDPGLIPNIQIGTVTTVESDQPAKVERTGTDENPIFNFEIPSGKDGSGSVDEEARAELQDIRVGYDGTTYESAGGAVRGQIKPISDEMIEQIKSVNYFITDRYKPYINGYYNRNNSGKFTSTDEVQSTEKIKVIEGDSFSISAMYAYNIAVITEFDNNGLFIKSILSSDDGTKKVNDYEYIVPSGVGYVAFSSYQPNKQPLIIKRKNIGDNVSLNEKTISDIDEIIRSEYFAKDVNVELTLEQKEAPPYGSNWAGKNSIIVISQMIEIKNGDTLELTSSNYGSNIPKLAVFDANKNLLYTENTSKDTFYPALHTDKYVINNQEARYAILQGFVGDNINIKDIVGFNFTKRAINPYIKDILNESNDILYGKKYVACGDSFTEGDFTGFVDDEGLSGKNSPYLYDSVWGTYKTYPYWIAKRNSMELINEAKCGSTMALSKEYQDGSQPIEYKNPFSLNRYKEVPLDADYLTIMFGLNEGGIPVGTLEDTDNTTIIGAYNIVLEYFVTNMPYCRIGIIISDAWLSQELVNAIKSVSEYWGIPWLDLRTDVKVPMMIGGRLGTKLNSKAIELRNSQYHVAPDNGHPNIESHKMRSRVVENFLRSL